MRVALSHQLDRDDVRARLRSRVHEIADFVPGGMADIVTNWPDDDRMELSIQAMGQNLNGEIVIEDEQIVITINLPVALGFVEPMISGAIKQKGRKMLE
jgi:hypothetical protein